MSRIAITGGTGFVGGHLLGQAVAAGHQVRALARRPQPERSGVEWVPGALEDAVSVARMVDGADHVIHVAGVVNARDRAGFESGNIHGTQAVLTAASAAGIRRFVHISSLAAREPGLSDYGWSKAEAERAVRAAPLDWSIVRPPAIYGPGDREMLDLFRMAARGIMLLPPGGRFSIIAAEDLARLLLTQLTAGTGTMLEPDDGRPNGWDHREFARTLGRALGRKKIRMAAIPGPLMRLGAAVDGLVRRGGAKLTPDRVRYFCHPDWVSHLPMPDGPWRPLVDTEEGLRATAAWYRAHGWL